MKQGSNAHFCQIVVIEKKDKHDVSRASRLDNKAKFLKIIYILVKEQKKLRKPLNLFFRFTLIFSMKAFGWKIRRPKRQVKLYPCTILNKGYATKKYIMCVTVVEFLPASEALRVYFLLCCSSCSCCCSCCCC
jgi:hypothetical protein